MNQLFWKDDTETLLDSEFGLNDRAGLMGDIMGPGNIYKGPFNHLVTGERPGAWPACWLEALMAAEEVMAE